MENMMKAASMLLLPEGQTLKNRFSPDEYEVLQKGVRSCSGYTLSMFDKLKPPALISLCYSQRNEGDLEATVDELLYKQAVDNGIITLGIESVEEQVAMLDKIPDSFVLEYFSNLDKQGDELEMLIRCYRNADLDSLLILIQEEESGAMLNEELITVRNFRMAERVIPMVRERSTFIAIGSGHLPGHEGVIALLKKEGYTVEPVNLW
jgi:uncharacterized protein YbaP (TraB family)